MIFITGGTGLLGAQLLCDTAKRDAPIRAMKRPSSDLNFVRRVFDFNNQSAQFEKIEWVDGDLLDVLGLEELLEGCSKVYHAAATVSFSKKDEALLMETNIEGTANIVNACLTSGVKKLCFASSISVFGREPGRREVDEETQWKRTPYNSNYAVSKYGAEREVWRGTEEGLDAVIVNPSMIIGPCEWDKSTGVLFRTVKKGMPFYTLGTNGFVDVRDVSRAMVELMESDIRNERFIVNGENLVFRHFFDLVADALNKKRPHLYARPWVSAIAWRLAGVAGWLTGSKPALTRETVSTSHMETHYANDKLRNRLGFEITPVKDAVERAVKFLEAQK